jgi:hypothetical protein
MGSLLTVDLGHIPESGHHCGSLIETHGQRFTIDLYKLLFQRLMKS